jgi:hypothetical protein
MNSYLPFEKFRSAFPLLFREALHAFWGSVRAMVCVLKQTVSISEWGRV